MILKDNTSTLLNQAEGTLIAQTTTVGSWELLGYNSPVIPIHAALLSTGKVFFFSGAGLDRNNTSCTNCSAVWDVSSGTFSRPVTPLDAAGIPVNLFCAGQSFRPNGQLMVAGGTLTYNPFRGSTSALFFDPSTETWIKVPSMNSGRWYPTLVTLGSGRILAVSGLDENGNLNLIPEIYISATGWTAFSQPTTSRFPLYSGLLLMQDGRLFYSGAYFENNQGVTPRILTLPAKFTQAITEQAVPGLVAQDNRNQAASVLLPPAQDQKVMVIGGGTEPYNGVTTSSVNIVDLKASSPTYTVAAPLNYGRMHHNAVLLPDRTVFVCNGSTTGEDPTKSALPAEIYNPATDTWTVVAAQSIPRLYHSTALLLPDGRVVAAGSHPSLTVQELRLEIYSPAYMSQTRPVINSAPQSVSYGRTIAIQTSQATSIKWVSLIRPMATTHACDTEQRLVDVPIASKTSTSLTVTVTSNRNLAPPGWYMLFINDDKGVPSVAKWIQLT